MRIFVHFFLIINLTILSICFIPSVVAYETLVKNEGFEEGLENWKTNNSNITFNISADPVFEGVQSASVSNNSTGSYGIEQIMTGIVENTDYLVSGRIKTVEPAPAKAYMRIAWYESPDASGSQIKTEDSEIISYQTDWKILSYVAKSPSSAQSAKIRLLVISGTAYFDNITLEYNISPTPIAQTPTPTQFITLPVTEPAPAEILPTAASAINNIYISEVMVYPETGQTEWVEIYNDNDVEITLLDWYIDDIENAGSSPKRFSMTMPAKSYGTLDISTAMFNNDSDSIRLLDSEELEKDSVTYTSSQKKYSLGKTSASGSTICFQNSSKNTANNHCADISPTSILGTFTLAKYTPPPSALNTPSPTPVSKKPHATNKPKQLVSLESTSKKLQPPARENILGAATEILINSPSPLPLIHTLTILAGSYSILSIISVLIKMTLRNRLFEQ